MPRKSKTNKSSKRSQRSTFASAASAAGSSMATSFSDASMKDTFGKPSVFKNSARHFISGQTGPADCDRTGSIRIVGRNQIFTPAYGTSGYGLISNGTITSGTVSYRISPDMDATNLSFIYNMADVYSRYVWRKVRLIYEPGCPSTTGGSIVLGLSNSLLPTGTTQADILQLPHSITTDVCGRAVVEYELPSYSQKTYPTNPFIEDAAFDNHQLYVHCMSNIAIYNGYTGAVFSAYVAIGVVSLEYEVDFYLPKSNRGSPTGLLDRLIKQLHMENSALKENKAFTALIQEFRNFLDKDSAEVILVEGAGSAGSSGGRVSQPTTNRTQR